MICPNCREDNAPTFRFCGMCGTSLEAPRPAGVLTPEVRRPVAAETVAKSANRQVPPIAGPSMLGLNQPSTSRPSMDALREPSFSGLDSFFEPEQPKSGGWRIVMLLALLAALGGAGWWTYTNYLGVAENRKPEATTPSAGGAPAGQPATKPEAKETAPTSITGSSQAPVPPATVPEGRVPEGQAAPATAAPAATRITANRAAKSAAEAKPVSPAKREPSMTSPKASKLPVPAEADTGDADFRKGEAYLYGRGAHANCDEAVKYLKAASGKSNAKARSAFGTMYATGHCVPRDLPTSYSWFALALRADPNNQILEKDLSAVWNQMTPPERQMATRMKQ